MCYTQLKAIFLIVFLTSFFPCFSQTVSQDTLFSQEYRKLNAMIDAGQFTEAITEGDTFLSNLAIQDSILLSYGNVLNAIGTAHYNYGTGDQAFWFTERALVIFTKLNHIQMADAYDRLGECHYWYTYDYDKALENCQKALAIHEQKTSDCSNKKSSVYANLGMIYAAQWNYSESLANYKKALACPNDDADLGRLNVSIGDFYLRQSLYSQALVYFSKAEFHFKKHYNTNENHPNIASAYANEAICFQYMGATAKAIIYYEKAQQIFEAKLGKKHPSILKIQAFIGFCYAHNEQYENALAILIPLSTQSFEGQQGLKTNVFDKIGFCYARQKNWKALEKLMPQLIDETENTTFSSLTDKVLVYRNIGINYRVAENYKQSSIFYQKALNLMDSVEKKDEKTMNLIYLEMANNAYDEHKTDKSIQYFEKILNNRSDVANEISLEYYYTIFGLSLAYYQKFETNSNKDYLNKAIDLMEKSVNIILTLRNDYIEDSDKQFLNDDGNIVFDKLIEMLLRKNALEPDANIVQKCFTLSEQNKSMRLLEAIKGLEIGKTSVLVDSIKAVKQTINKVENQIVAAQKDSAKTNLEYWKAQLFDLNQEHQRLVNTLKVTAEADFKNLYQPDILSVESVQKGLNVDQTLLEYFVGDSSIFIFTINKSDAKVTEVKKDFPLEQWIQQMRTGIYGSFLSKMRDDSLVKRTNRYVEAATQLYAKLVAPVQNILRGSVVVIPDGVMGNLPFDALLMDKPTNIARPQNFNYLLEKHKISYCYSATLLNEMVKKTHRQTPKQPFLGFAPLFKKANDTPQGNKNKFEPLDNAAEITALQRIVGGDTLIGNKATKASFMQNAENYRMLHLSTHGKMDDKMGDYSYLAFAQTTDTTDYELLYTRELYNMSLNADMVVLSACETGIGELQRGEGIISLARAFAFAGAKSIVTTLWRVNDAATKELMLLFYENLKDGKSKDDALWLAKRAYISRHKNEAALPYFWSGLVPIGDMKAIRQ